MLVIGKICSSGMFLLSKIRRGEIVWALRQAFGASDEWEVVRELRWAAEVAVHACAIL